MSILRRLKLSKLLNISLSLKDEEILFYIKNVFKDIEKTYSLEYNGDIFFSKNQYTYFIFVKDDNKLYYHYDHIFTKIQKIQKLNIEELEIYIKYFFYVNTNINVNNISHISTHEMLIIWDEL